LVDIVHFNIQVNYIFILTFCEMYLVHLLKKNFCYFLKFENIYLMSIPV